MYVNWAVIVGDARTSTKGLETKSIQACVTSPPYWQMRDYRCPDQIGLEQTPELYIETLSTTFDDIHRVLRDDGTLWINLGDSYFAAGSTTPAANDNARYAASKKMAGTHPGGSYGNRPIKPRKHPFLKPKDLIGLPWLLALALQRRGWWLRQDIIWHKPNPLPRPDTDRCTTAHEYIFLLSKSKKYYFDHKVIQEVTADGGTRNRRSVWTVPTRAPVDTNFATYPTALIDPIIAAASPPGSVILDPFCGTGTTGVAAVRAGRHFIGIEANGETSDTAKKNLSVASAQQKLFRNL